MDLDKILGMMTQQPPDTKPIVQYASDKPWWTGWVNPEYLSASETPKRRPWTAYKRQNHTFWIPRSSKRPYSGLRYAVYSPVGHLKFKIEGYFFMTKYKKTDRYFDSHGKLQGYMDKKTSNELRKKLNAYIRERR